MNHLSSSINKSLRPLLLLLVVIQPMLAHSQYHYGDVNHDGLINVTDVNNLISMIMTDDGSSPDSSFFYDDSRHVLMVGNSFTNNGVEYIDNICEHLALSTNHSIQRICMSNATLKRYAEIIASDGYLPGGSVLGTIYGNGINISKDMTLREIISQDWDIITFQQSSNVSDDYSTYTPYLTTLIECVLANCPNKHVKIMFNMTWGTNRPGSSIAPYNGYTDTLGGVSTYVPGIIDAVRSMMEDHGHIISMIPSGTAVQNLRGTSLNSHEEGYLGFTYDNQHMANGAGRYVAACILFQSLFSDLISGSLYDDNTKVEHPSDQGGSSYGKCPVTDENRKIIQRCAMYAYINPWSAMTIPETDDE